MDGTVVRTPLRTPRTVSQGNISAVDKIFGRPACRLMVAQLVLSLTTGPCSEQLVDMIGYFDTPRTCLSWERQGMDAVDTGFEDATIDCKANNLTTHSVLCEVSRRL